VYADRYGGKRGEGGTPPGQGIDQGQSRISVEDLYQSMEVRARRGTALTMSVPPRLFPEKRKDAMPSLSFSFSFSLNLPRERVYKSILRTHCLFAGVTLANWLVLLPSEIKHRLLANNRTMFFNLMCVRIIPRGSTKAFYFYVSLKLEGFLFEIYQWKI